MVKAIYNKIDFYISSNKVVLSEGINGGSIPPNYFRTVLDLTKNEYIYQAPIDYLCVYDFECQCDKEKNKLKFNEIIEFPIVVIDVQQKKVIAEY